MISKAALRPVAASLVMAAAIVVCLVEPAFAQAAGVETVLQNIVDMLTGNIARLLAVIAVPTPRSSSPIAARHRTSSSCTAIIWPRCAR
ncbi:TrbC/VirB2 family protein [Rhizobium brockwellii]|uniref:TrbC/VirB2 family protein n=1 Tax=Rhizobium brockwellii TaxID=3019932 RepID=UPI00293DDFC0|nr:TrbC/VirB2 family protein [Rhizobium brockwellii]MDV4154772.1 TrbC/VirB2 family protein [Rhizobium brockwellii]